MLTEIKEREKQSLTSAELNVIDWINENEEKIPDMSINEIADASFTSPATVSRAIRKCGFSGIAEMKYKISSQMNYIVEGKIVNEIFEKSMILRVIRYIRFSEKIYILARGTTALIARDFEFQLQLLGYNAFVLSDSQIMRNSKKLFKENDIVMIFTLKNSTPELEMSAKFAKEVGATVITCCCIQGTSLEKYSDLSILGGRKKNNSMIEEFNVMSRLPLHIIARTLIDYLTL
jgi:DNA-binding MurR/RpiR family transcriptional regulator